MVLLAVSRSRGQSIARGMYVLGRWALGYVSFVSRCFIAVDVGGQSIVSGAYIMSVIANDQGLVVSVFAHPIFIGGCVDSSDMGNIAPDYVVGSGPWRPLRAFLTPVEEPSSSKRSSSADDPVLLVFDLSLPFISSDISFVIIIVFLFSPEHNVVVSLSFVIEFFLSISLRSFVRFARKYFRFSMTDVR